MPGCILRLNDPFADVAGQMRQGGMAAICLAMGGGRARHSARNPMAGSCDAFAGGGRTLQLEPAGFPPPAGIGARTEACRDRQRRRLAAAKRRRRSIIVSAEGADFLEGKAERLDEVVAQYGLRICN